MSRMTQVATLVIALLMLGALWGCSLQDKSSNSTPADPPVEGSLDDDEYQSTSEALSMSQGYTNDMLAELFAGIGRIDSISGAPSLTPGPGSVFASTQADSVAITYDETTGYWHIQVESDDEIEGVSFVFIDSLQFRTDQGVVQWPVETVTQIRAGLRMTAQAIDGSPNAPDLMNLEYAEQLVVSGEIMSEGVITVTGDGAFGVAIQDTEDASSCNISFDMTAEYWEMEIDLASLDPDACPTGGTMSSTGSMDWYCTGDGLTLDVSGSWEAMATYDGSNVVMVVESDGTNWTYTGPCNEI